MKKRVKFNLFSNQFIYFFFILLFLAQLVFFHFTPFKQVQYCSTDSNSFIDASIQQSDDNKSILTLGERRSLNDTSGDFDPSHFQFRPNSLIYEPLIDYDAENEEFIPVLASQFVVTKDSKIWTFYLKENISFHDHSKFNATAVKFSVERSFVSKVDFVEIVNEFLVKIHFNQPYAQVGSRDAPYILIASPNSFNGTHFNNPIGTGPYKVNLELSNSSFLRFNRFESYHQGLAPFEQIYYKLYPAFSIPGQYFDEFGYDILNNNLDYIGSGNYIGPVDYSYWEDQERILRNRPIINFGIFNLNRPELANVNVRKAINYGVNKVSYSEPNTPGTEPIGSLIPQGILGHDPSIEGYPYDFDKANVLLDQEGYFRDENGTRFSLDLVTSTLVNNGSIASLIESLNSLGIRCNLIIDPYIMQMALEGEFDLAVLVWGVDDPSWIDELLYSDASFNFGGFSNEYIDQLIEWVQKTPVRQEREYYYTLVQQIAQQECPSLLLARTYWGYWKSKRSSPYFYVNPNRRFEFIYSGTSQQPDKVKIVKDIEIQTESLYVPVTDTVITNDDEESFTFTIKMSNYLDSFIPDQSDFGKFFQLEDANEDNNYKFRVYYDLDEVSSVTLTDLTIHSYDGDSNTWHELETFSSNTSLRYIEVQINNGDSLFRIGRKLLERSFYFAPLFLLVILGVIGVSLYTIFKNFQLSEKFREEIDL